MSSFPWLRAVAAGANGPHRLHGLFLDTTYCKPCYIFPAQADVVRAVLELVLMHRGLDAADTARARAGKLSFAPESGANRTLFLFGTYSIGKERLFMEVARALNEPVFVSKSKLKLMSCFGWSPSLMVRLRLPLRCVWYIAQYAHGISRTPRLHVSGAVDD
jgi:hypothetical protein